MSSPIVIMNILWDVDGTLFDTYPAITFALSKSLNELRFSIAMNMVDSLARQSINDCVETLSQRFKLDPNLLHRRFSKSYLAIDPANQPPIPGAREICRFIYQLGGSNIIVTHRDVQVTNLLLETHEMAAFFLRHIFNVEQGYAHKPNPEIVLAAINRYELDPDQTLLIGNRDLDIEAGRVAGINTCLFGKMDSTKLADIQIENYTQLLTYLQETTS